MRVCVCWCVFMSGRGWVGGGMTWMLGYECDQGREATYVCVCVAVSVCACVMCVEMG